MLEHLGVQGKVYAIVSYPAQATQFARLRTFVETARVLFCEQLQWARIAGQ